MALYDYLCVACQNTFDLMRPMSEAHESAVCPRCGSGAQRILAGSSETEVGAANAAIQPAGMGPASDIEYRAGSHGGLPGESLREVTDHQRQAGNTTVVAATVPGEEAAADSRVDLRADTAPLEMPQLTEYEPGGANLWHLRDWGIASMFGYLRDRRGTEAANTIEDHQGADQPSPTLLETDSAAGAAEAADRHPSASEWQIATSVMPWLEEMRRESSEADKENSDIAGEETDMPGSNRVGTGQP